MKLKDKTTSDNLLKKWIDIIKLNKPESPTYLLPDEGDIFLTIKKLKENPEDILVLIYNQIY